MTDVLLDRPRWLNWRWALTALDQEVRVNGEQVRPAEGVIATAYLLSDGPAVVTVSPKGSQLAVTMPETASGSMITDMVVRRFHLYLDAAAVRKAIDATGLPGLETAAGWVRRPAAAALWSYCLVFLCGGDPDAAAVRTMFGELGHVAGQLMTAPDPADVLSAGERRLTSFGIAPHRVANVLGLARAFVANPGRFDESALRALPAKQAIARIAELPHIGSTRARTITSVALGHDDVLVDLSRHHELLRKLGLSWPQVQAAARRAAPYRSILGDALLDQLED